MFRKENLVSIVNEYLQRQRDAASTPNMYYYIFYFLNLFIALYFKSSIRLVLLIIYHIIIYHNFLYLHLCNNIPYKSHVYFSMRTSGAFLLHGSGVSVYAFFKLWFLILRYWGSGVTVYDFFKLWFLILIYWRCKRYCGDD